MENNNTNEFKSGFVAILGAPNAGKSTLLNRILKEKISITSKKPQTTRDRILGIVHRPLSQLIFIDTPGIHKAKGALNTRIVEAAFSAVGDVDIILLIIDLDSPDNDSENYIIQKLQKQNKKVILALNKVDCVKKKTIFSVIEKWRKAYSFDSVIPISAKHGDQVEVLLDAMEKILPYGPPLYSEDMFTDKSERFIVAEMIREKVFRLTGQEMPYSTAVTIESFSEKEKLVEINATIHVEKSSQKGIIIGKNGSKLKKIGEEARKDIQKMLCLKVFLKLFVRVQKNWSNDTKALRRFGY